MSKLSYRYHLFKNTILVCLIIFITNETFSQTPQVEYTKLESYYNTGHEISCTARIYSFGLIDELCAIHYNIYKDKTSSPIKNVNEFGSIKYTVRGKGSDYITQSIADGSGYLSLKQFFVTYTAFTLGIFDNYCVARNRPVSLKMTFKEPGNYYFNTEIQSCSNSKSWLLTNYTSNGSKGCDNEKHKDYASYKCDAPTTLHSKTISITICAESLISFHSGETEYFPNDNIYLVYSIGDYDNRVNTKALPSWISARIDDESNTLTLTGNAPPYDINKSTISFNITTYSTVNPSKCSDATVTQTINILNPNNALRQLEKHSRELDKMSNKPIINKN